MITDMPDHLSQFKCPNCSAPLAWSAELQKLHCEACGSAFAPDEEFLKTQGVKNDTEFDWGDYKKKLQTEPLDGVRTYTCVSCGATVEVDENTAATKCPYCDNNVILNEQLSGGIRPNAIIPFKITPKELPDRVRAFFKHRPLLPKSFLSDNVIGKAQGVYVPFWLYDCKVEGPMNLQGVIVHTYTRGDYRITETNYYLLERDGEMCFSRIPVDGSVKMDDDLMDSIEPFNYGELVDFQSDYLTGYLADRFDDDPDACLPRASKRLMHSAESVMKGTCHGFGEISFVSNGMQITDANVRYVLLPVYLLNCEYGGKQYRYAINGQTGKVVGDLPISKAKSWLYFGGGFLALWVLICSLFLGTGVFDFLKEIFLRLFS